MLFTTNAVETIERNVFLIIFQGAAAAAFGSDVYTMSPDEKAPTLASKLMESPGSATLRFRKQPFIRIDYAIQVRF